jgi:phospholipid N-methyltransferase
MVHRLLSGLPWDRIETFVEFGPGTGSFTRYALERLPANARLLALDAERRFTEHLREAIPDRRLIAITGSALDVADIVRAHGARRIDCALSGLPFSTIEEVDRRKIISRSAEMMEGSGIFLAYQVRRAIEPHLREAFESVTRRYHWLNLPPCQLYRATLPR